jgi:hypothetical protein
MRMAACPPALWLILEQLHKRTPSDQHDARATSHPNGGEAMRFFPVGKRMSGAIVRTDTMFAFLRRKPRPATYQWKPAVDLTDPRVAAILKTYGWA